MKAHLFLLLAFGGLLLCAGCAVTPPPKPAAVPSRPSADATAAPKPLVLTKTDFSRLPGWGEVDPSAALAAFAASCAEMTARPSRPAVGLYGGSTQDWIEVCRAARLWSGSAKAFFENRFVPVLVAAGQNSGGKNTDGQDSEGLFTGYYEPQIRARATPDDTFRTPVYGRPTDMVEVDLGAFRPALKGDRIAGRVAGGRLVPMPKRERIVAEGVRNAPVLFYTDDPVDLFFLQIQGSGRVCFDDGTVKRVGYDGQNGWPYTAIGKVLAAQGALTHVSLESLKAWLRDHPKEAQTVMNANESYVFFKPAPLGDPTKGPKGAEGVALTALGSMAVDTKYHGLGVPFFVSTTAADGTPLDVVLVAQDRGGAIRGAVRGDIFFGFGAPAAAKAGAMKGRGTMVALLPAAVAGQMADKTVLVP